MRIAANLTMLFREYDFFERFDRAAEAGFTGVEFFFPYAHDLTRIADAASAMTSSSCYSTCPSATGTRASADMLLRPGAKRNSAATLPAP